MNKDTIAVKAWKKHLSKEANKRKAANKTARQSRKAQRQGHR